MLSLFDLILSCCLVLLMICFVVCFLLWKKFKRPAYLSGFYSKFDKNVFQPFCQMNKSAYACIASKDITKKRKICFVLFWLLGFLSEVVFEIVGWCFGMQIRPFVFLLGILILYLYMLMVVNAKFFVTKKYKVRLISLILVLILLVVSLVEFSSAIIFGLSGYLSIVRFVATIGNMVFYGTLLYNGFSLEPGRVEKILVYAGAALAIILQCLGLFGCFSVAYGYIEFFAIFYSICATLYMLFFFDFF